MQTRLGSHIAVALVQAGGYSSDWTPSLGTSICHGSSPRKGKKEKKKKKERAMTSGAIFDVRLAGPVRWAGREEVKVLLWTSVW